MFLFLSTSSDDDGSSGVVERQAGGVRSGLPQQKNAEASRSSKQAIGLNTYISVGVLAIGLLLLNYIRSFMSSGEKLGNYNNNEI